MKMKEFMIETFQNVSINGILYSLNSDEKKIYTKVKETGKLLKSELSEFDQRIANNLVTRGLLKRRKNPQHEIYFVAKGRRKVANNKPIDEVAPPDTQIEKWINDNKERFEEKYGKQYKKYLYGKAWNKFNGKKITESYYVKRQSEFGNTGVMFDNDYINFQPGMRLVDENNNVWTIETRVKLRAEYNPPLTLINENGQKLNTTMDELNTDVFQLEKFKPIFDPKFFDKNDGL